MFDVIEKIRNDPSRIGKEELLKNNGDNELFVDTMKFVFNPFITTGLSSKKIQKSVLLNPNVEFKSYQDLYAYLEKNNTGTDQIIANVQAFIKSQPKENQKTIIEIVTKELTIGITSVTINKVWGKVIPSFGVMLAERYDENHRLFTKGRNFIISQKLDGHRCAAIHHNGVNCFTRQGKPYDGMIEIEEALSYFSEDYVYDGELLALNPDNLSSKDLFRVTGSLVRSTGLKRGVVFNIFDMIPLKDFEAGYSPIPCIERKAKLAEEFEKIKGKNFTSLKLVENRYVGDEQCVIDKYLQAAIENDEEGIMINFADCGYECKRTTALLKYKKFNTCDVRCIDIYAGDGKLSGTLGGITCEFMAPDNKVYVVQCGSGFSDDQRALYWAHPELLIGHIVELQYFEYSQSMDGAYSLRFPVWLNNIRTDKNELSRF